MYNQLLHVATMYDIVYTHYQSLSFIIIHPTLWYPLFTPAPPPTPPRCQGIQHREIGAGDVDANGGSLDQRDLEIH